jgi:hypothetical protein
MSTTETMDMEETTPIIPKTCKAGVVCNPGPDFTVCHPRCAIDFTSHIDTVIPDRSSRYTSTRDWSRRSSDQTQCHRPLHVRCPLHDGGLGSASNVSSTKSHKQNAHTYDHQVSIWHQVCWSRRRRCHRQDRRKSQEPQDWPTSRTQTYSRCVPYVRILQDWKGDLLPQFCNDWSPYRW